MAQKSENKRKPAKYKIDRRLGVNLWGRPKSPVNIISYAPGEHGQRRKKPSDYGVQLMAKQKLKGYYWNIGEKQFRIYFAEADRRRGDTGQNLIGILDETQQAEGLQIFIGSENNLFGFTGCSTIISPFRNKDKEIIGAIGVIGPMRIN